jgi:hypothetical protein
MYEIQAPSLVEFPEDIEQVYEDPRLLEADVARLRKLFPNLQIIILKDGNAIAENRLRDEKRDFEIALVIDAADRVPSGYRRAWGGDGDDVAKSGKGVTGVWRPRNPED